MTRVHHKKQGGINMLFIRIVMMVLICFGLMACQFGALKNIVKAPEVKSIQLKSFSVQDKIVVFDVGLFNPNAFSLSIDSFDGGIKLNGFDVGKFAVKTDTSLPAKEVQTITLPMTLDAEMLGRATRSVLADGQALYHFKGGVDTSVGNVTFSKDGELSMQGVIKTLIPSLGF